MVSNELYTGCFVPLGRPWPVGVIKLKERAQGLQEPGSLCNEAGHAPAFLGTDW